MKKTISLTLGLLTLFAFNNYGQEVITEQALILTGRNTTNSVNNFYNRIQLDGQAHSAIVHKSGSAEELMFGFHDNGNFYWGTGRSATNPDYYSMRLNGNTGDLKLNGSIGNIEGGSLRVQTDSGYLDLGPKNTGWAHIYTDLPKIIFNKDVYTTSNAFSSYNNDLILKTEGNERLRINDETGNIGIGTSDPKNKLSVNGTIWATEVKVSLTDAADWVFEDDYNLKPLEEVEKFIQKNKHLPEIPSAEEFRKNDLKVSEMSNKLLQKIEELILYTIQQEKKIKNLENLNKNRYLKNMPDPKEVEAPGIEMGEIIKIQQKKIEELTLYLIAMDKRVKSIEEENTSLQKELVKLNK